MANTLTADYFQRIQSRYKAGNATEHTYRGDLQQLIENLVAGIVATNEPQRIQCGAPDYVLTRKDIPVGYIEAKDLGVSLDAIEKSEQLKRYRESLENLILTDYIEFRLFRNGEKVNTIKIAAHENGKLKPLPENYSAFENFITDFCTQTGQTITSAEKLAKMMAGKARMMALVLENALQEDIKDVLNPDTSLQQQFQAFQLMLIHDLKEQQFADIYAQTIAYGMFAARLHDPTLTDFTRREAAELIPQSNPFLRRLFQFIAGYDLDTRLAWIVDALADVFRAADVKAILKNFGRSTQTLDPMIHFYETFLGEYNPAERKKRGVYYTPEPVVNFIVRAVDDILKTEFGLKEGLASTETTDIEVAVTDKKGKATKQKKTVHRVQILDPATGTGTFLAEIIKQIYKKFEGQQGIWSDYVGRHLIPRVNGFEILMASYAMCHLKLDMLLAETGFVPKKQSRFRVFLTNSLEEAAENSLNLFTQWLSNESIEANAIKRDTPVMVVVGNPPYAVSSSNKGEWINQLMEDYKKGLNEKNMQPLSDDYLKFIRYAQHFIEKNGQGIVALITNNSFIDGIIHRQMRKNLLDSFDKIYVIDLHGNSKKKEVAMDGSPDENVFDIQQGVSITLLIKKVRHLKSKEFYRHDIRGKRDAKYDFLMKHAYGEINWKKLIPEGPDYFFYEMDAVKKVDFDLGFKLNDLMSENSGGLKTHRDELVIDYDNNNLRNRLSKFFDKSINNSDLISMFQIKETSSWNLSDARNYSFNEKLIMPITYRPFDNRWIYYFKPVVDRSREEVMKHMLHDNVALICARSNKTNEVDHFFITSFFSEMKTGESSNGSYHFPLYLYPETTNQHQLHTQEKRRPNLDPKIVEQIAKGLRLKFVAEKTANTDEFAPIDLLDYIYAVLHSPSYREKYKEFLKIDFPRVPYPSDKKQFWKLVELGGELRQLHLLEHEKVNKLITKFPVSGNNEVVKPEYKDSKVYINSTQYFESVPSIAWDFFIGGYQPAQKWLKDRKGRTLSFEDILHYQKMIVALYETDKLMKKIDSILFP